jgi:hypothetical protein
MCKMEINIEAKLHYHNKTIHIEIFEDGKLVEHSCIAFMNSNNNSPLMGMFTEQICRRWNTQDILVRALKHCRGRLCNHGDDLEIIDTALSAIKPLLTSK